MEDCMADSVPNNNYIIVRLDGVGFTNKVPRLYKKPFDPTFQSTMICSAVELMYKFNGVYCQTGSDEMSILLPRVYMDYNRRKEKLTSLMSGMLSSYFLAYYPDFYFDAKLFYTEDFTEVVDYYFQRLRSVYANAVSDALLHGLTIKKSFSAARFQQATLNKNLEERLRMLEELAVYVEQPDFYSRIVFFDTYQKEGYNPISKTPIITERRQSKFLQATAEEIYGTLKKVLNYNDI